MDKKILACIDAILEKYNKNTKMDRQTVIDIAADYELSSKDIPVLERELSKLNITLVEDRSIGIINKISKFI